MNINKDTSTTTALPEKSVLWIGANIGAGVLAVSLLLRFVSGFLFSTFITQGSVLDIILGVVLLVLAVWLGGKFGISYSKKRSQIYFEKIKSISLVAAAIPFVFFLIFTLFNLWIAYSGKEGVLFPFEGLLTVVIASIAVYFFVNRSLSKANVGDEELNTEQPFSKFNKKILIIGVAISLSVFIVGGTFIALYTQVWNPEWSPFTKEQVSAIDLEQEFNEEELNEDNYSLVYIYRKYEISNNILEKKVFLQDVLKNSKSELVLVNPITDPLFSNVLSTMRVSPNSRDIAYIDDNKIFLTSAEDLNFTAITEVAREEGGLYPIFSWSNDGSEIVYFVFKEKTNSEVSNGLGELKIYKINIKTRENKFLTSLDDIPYSISQSVIGFNSEKDRLIIRETGHGIEGSSRVIARIINSETGDIIEEVFIVVNEYPQFNLPIFSEKIYYIEDDYFVVEYNSIIKEKRILYESPHKGQDVFISQPILSSSGTKLVFTEFLRSEKRTMTKIFNMESQSIETIFENYKFSNKAARHWSPNERFLWFGVGMNGWGEEGEYFIYDLTAKNIVSVLDGQYILGGTQERASFVGWVLNE